MVAHRRTAATSREELAELMVGRRVLLRVEKGPRAPARAGARGRRTSRSRDDQGVPRVKDVELRGPRAARSSASPGVAGNGQSELLEALAGIRHPARGAIMVSAASRRSLRRRAQALRAGGSPTCRRTASASGSVAAFAAWENAILGYQDERRVRAPARFLRRLRIVDLCRPMDERLRRPPARAAARAANFSGGNQQKLVLAREMEHDPDVLLVGQPTRGVDIGAIEFIHAGSSRMRDAGKAMLLVSVELDEILALCRPHPGDVRRPHRRRAGPTEADERKVGPADGRRSTDREAA